MLLFFTGCFAVKCFEDWQGYLFYLDVNWITSFQQDFFNIHLVRFTILSPTTHTVVALHSSTQFLESNISSSLLSWRKGLPLSDIVSYMYRMLTPALKLVFVDCHNHPYYKDTCISFQSHKSFFVCPGPTMIYPLKAVGLSARPIAPPDPFSLIILCMGLV